MTLPSLHLSVSTGRSNQTIRKIKRMSRATRIKPLPHLPSLQLSPPAYSGRQRSIDCLDLDPWISSSESPPSNSRNLPNGEQAHDHWKKCEMQLEHLQPTLQTETHGPMRRMTRASVAPSRPSHSRIAKATSTRSMSSSRHSTPAG